MNLISNTPYEDAIEDLLRAHTESTVSDGLKLLFTNYWNNGASGVNSEIDAFCQIVAAPIKSKADITQSKLKNYVGKQLIVRLRNADKEQKQSLQERCEVIFKFLKDSHKDKELTKSKIAFINEKVGLIREEAVFPKVDPNKNIREGVTTKYRALTNLLKGEVDSGEKATLKLAIAIFGIDIPRFKLFLESLGSEEKPEAIEEISQEAGPKTALQPDHQSEKPHLYKSQSEPSTFTQWLGASKYRKPLVVIIVLALLSVTSFFGYDFFSRQRVKGEGLRPTIKSSDLFGRQFKLDPADFDISDSLFVVTDTVFTEDLLIGRDTIGLEKLIIKLRIVNLKSDEVYFPDAIYFKPTKYGTFSGQVQHTGSALNVNANLNIILDAEQTWPYEWTITSSPPNERISPLTEQYTVLKISGKENMKQVLVPFTILFKVHDRSGLSRIVSSDREYKIAFE